MATEQVARARATAPPGTRFGRYEVIAEIASGGMATVFLGRALGAAGFQRLVAIKVLHPHVEHDEDFVAMFMDEARLAARIRHPNVVPTLDLENSEDGLFLVMEFVEGDGLLGVLRALVKSDRAVPASIAVRLALDILHGLHAAHELTGDRGEPLRLVHRDVSPHNILVGVDGVARITDFGIASAEQRIGTTREGQVKGKLAYMAPEQTEAGPIDRRVDVFALGVVLWECLTGQRLFWGANDGAVLKNVLHKVVPSVREYDPKLPEALDKVVLKALERDPNKRFSTAAQFADALEEAGGSVGIASTRAVATLVRELSGPRIDVLSNAARAYSADLATSSVRPLPRTRATTDPDRTARRSDPPSLDAKTGRISVPTGRLVPATLVHDEINAALPIELVTRAERPSNRAAPIAPEAPHGATRGGPGVWFAGGMGLMLLLAGGAALAHRAGTPSPTTERVGAAIVVGPTLTPGAPAPQHITDLREAPSEVRVPVAPEPLVAARTNESAPPTAPARVANSANGTNPTNNGAAARVRRASNGAATPVVVVARPAAPARTEGTSAGFNPEAM